MTPREVRAPIALFTYNRPEHLRRTLESLAACPESAQSRLVVFSDGPRHALDEPGVARCRAIVEERSWCRAVELVARPSNLGLARSIAQGVGEVSSRWGRVIVLEDDLVMARRFLAYMNEALARYQEDTRVFQISGHSFPARGYGRSRGSSFLPFPTTWGWGTWHRAWSRYDAAMNGSEALDGDEALRLRFDLNGAYPYHRMLRALRRRGRLEDSWGIRWYWSMFRNDGVALYPHRTLIAHAGEDGSGTNWGPTPPIPTEFDTENLVDSMPERIQTNLSYYAAVKRHLAQQNTLLRRGERLFHRVLQRSVPGLRRAAS
jgi:glycosyl transferase family 2